jgi:hypothetical protein
MSRLVSVRYRCPKCDATHCRPVRIDGDEPPATQENTCIAPHPERGADFEGCGEDVELEAIAWREDRDDDWIPLGDDVEIATDGGQERKECPYRGCEWTGRPYDPEDTVETIAAEEDATIHWENEHGGEIPDDAEFGEQQCPECYAVHGMNGSVSCSECGFIPREVRADGGQKSEPTTVVDALEAIFKPFAANSKRTTPETLEPGEYEAIQREDGAVELYEGLDKSEPLMSVPETDAERIADALDEATGGDA